MTDVSQRSLKAALKTWGGQGDIWVFAYASLIWRPEFEEAERRPARVYGWHRTLKMWSTLNRGTPQVPGLVFALLPGGSCQGMAVRMRQENVSKDLPALWSREMPGAVYEPRFLKCATAMGAVSALAFTLAPDSPECCGELSPERIDAIFKTASGRFGSTRDYAVQTYQSLKANGIDDSALHALLASVNCHAGN